MWVINDDSLFGSIIKNPGANKETIEAISEYVYDEIKLDTIFKIEKWLNALLAQERVLPITKKRHRDHLLHACRIAVMGEKILKGKISTKNNEEFTLLDLITELFKEGYKDPKKRIWREYFDYHEIDLNDEESLQEKILQIWYIASLFHDIGFIYETFEETWRSIGVLKDTPKFSELFSDVNASLMKFQKSYLLEQTQKEYKFEIPGRFGHAAAGASILYNLVGKKNLNCDIAADIVYHHSIASPMAFTDHPLLALLILLDEVQEWQRPVILRGRSPERDSEPDLLNTEVQSDRSNSFEMTVDNNLKFEFILNYGDRLKILQKTDFSFPYLLYSKFNNFQYLRVNGTRTNKLPEAVVKKICGLDNLELSGAVKIQSEGELAKHWTRQCDLLRRWAIENGNITIRDWLTNVVNIDYKTPVFESTLNIFESPLKIDANFETEAIQTAFDRYLEDKDIIDEEFNATHTYKKANNDQVIWHPHIERTLILKNNSARETVERLTAYFGNIRIKKYGNIKAYAGSIPLKYKILLPEKRINGGIEYYDWIGLVFFLKESGLVLGTEPLKINYDIEIFMPTSDLKCGLIDEINNTHLYPIKKGKVTVCWDRDLFWEKRFFGTIAYESIEERDRILSNLSSIKNKLQAFNLELDYDVQYPGRGDRPVTVEFTELKTGESAGLIWFSRD
ncbi:MAG TPA: hypothetical protein VMW40_07135 [Candidatus Bathyarchaeia archaeon]|nr:hypothetical protein [Candidatus Bathyarchaeia archaeon]